VLVLLLLVLVPLLEELELLLLVLVLEEDFGEYFWRCFEQEYFPRTRLRRDCANPVDLH
jgi:hypothetical protein